jgi:hypothetical protein
MAFDILPLPGERGNVRARHYRHLIRAPDAAGRRGMDLTKSVLASIHDPSRDGMDELARQGRGVLGPLVSAT